MGDSNLSILIISENSINKVLAEMLVDRKIEILLENKLTEDLSGLILLTNKLNDQNAQIDQNDIISYHVLVALPKMVRNDQNDQNDQNDKNDIIS